MRKIFNLPANSIVDDLSGLPEFCQELLEEEFRTQQ